MVIQWVAWAKGTHFEVEMPQLEDELGDIISKARSGLGLSVRELASGSGLSEGEIVETESYRLVPARARLDALARTLSLDPQKLAVIAEGWSPLPTPQTPAGLAFETVPVTLGGYVENCYIVECVETRSAAVVDPGGAVDRIIDRLASGGYCLELVLITHAHGDHVGGLRQLIASKPDARVVSHSVERRSLGKVAAWQPAEDGARTRLGNLEVTMLHTPGHTRGSMCYLVEPHGERDQRGSNRGAVQRSGVCFVGDTVFAGSIGRCASPEAYKPMLFAIRAKLLSLPDSTILLPGHGPATIVGEEKRHNPFF